MLQSVPRDAVAELIERNTEPFVNEVGLLTRGRAPGHPALPAELDAEGDYVVEDDYGRVWSRTFFGDHAGLLDGPCHPSTVMFANHGFLAVPFRKVPRRRVTTREELYATLHAMAAAGRMLYPGRVVVYRGQSQEYTIPRPAEERERLFGSADAVEPSLRPSGTRRQELGTIARAVWSQLVQMYVAREAGYNPAHRYLDTGEAWSLATRHARSVTLAFAQHYGLPTPALDVTSDAGVALWFALHTFSGSGVLTAAAATGGDGVVYVIAGERGQYFDEGIVPTHALRPRRQHGGFLASNWGNSKNRVVRYLVGAVYFPHELLLQVVHELPTAAFLFPGPREDRFVKRIQQIAWHERHGSPVLAEIAANVYWVDEPASPAPDNGGVTLNDRDDSRTDDQLREAAEGGDMAAAYRLGLRRHLLDDQEAAERWCRTAALGGNLDGACLLGMILTSRGDPQGEAWTRGAAEAGQPNAMNNLGLLNAHRGDNAEAERWYQRAAEAGVVEAAYNLGTLLYRTGRRDQGERWLAAAADAGDPDAACNLGKICYDRRDDESAERWFRVAAERGIVAAAFNLGQLCEHTGRTAEALDWFRRAATGGDPDAPYRIARLEAAQP